MQAGCPRKIPLGVGWSAVRLFLRLTPPLVSSGGFLFRSSHFSHQDEHGTGGVLSTP